MTITYCTAADLSAVYSQAAIVRCCDDDEDGALSTEESGFLQRAIERGANRMNASLEMRYRLSDLAGNGWCRDANTTLALYYLATRRGNPAPEHLHEQYDALVSDLDEIRGGRLNVPQAPEPFASLGDVANFRPSGRAGAGGESIWNVPETD